MNWINVSISNLWKRTITVTVCEKQEGLSALWLWLDSLSIWKLLHKRTNFKCAIGCVLKVNRHSFDILFEWDCDVQCWCSGCNHWHSFFISETLQMFSRLTPLTWAGVAEVAACSFFPILYSIGSHRKRCFLKSDEFLHFAPSPRVVV